jgi:hypothetical protein
MNFSPSDGIVPPSSGESSGVSTEAMHLSSSGGVESQASEQQDVPNTSRVGEDSEHRVDTTGDSNLSDQHSEAKSPLAGSVDTNNLEVDASGLEATPGAARKRTAKKSMALTSHSSMAADGVSSEMLASPARKRLNRNSVKSAHRESIDSQLGGRASAESNSSAEASEDEENDSEHYAGDRCDAAASESGRAGDRKALTNRQEDQDEASVPFAQAQPVPTHHGALRVYPTNVSPPSPNAETLEFVAGGGEEDDDEGWIIHHRQDSEDVEVVASSPRAVSTLIEARLVSEHVLVEALPLEQPHLRSVSSEATLLELVERQSRKRRRLWIAIIVLVTIVIILVVGITLGTMLISSPPSPAETDKSFLLSNLPNYTIWSLDNPGSAQYQALQWVLDDKYVSTDVASEDRQRRLIQRYALAVLFYAASGGIQWRPVDGNWLVRNSNECEWHGCTCSIDNRLQHISVRGVPLSPTGYLPPEIALLSDLVSLDGGNTSIQGTLPTQIGQLNLLRELRADHTSIAGALITELGYLTALSTLTLQSTGIRGTIPKEVAALTRLSTLRLDQTGLAGTIPTVIGLLTNLTTLSLKSTSLGGTLPTEFGLLSKLALLELQETWIRGEVPQELCNLITEGTLNISVRCWWVNCSCGCSCGTDLLDDAYGADDDTVSAPPAQ